MNKILDFLRSQSENENLSDNSVDKGKLAKSFNDFKNIDISFDVSEKNIFKLKSIPKIKKGQLWLCKKDYYDALGNEIIGKIPYIVLVVSNPDQFGDNSFLRIQPISPFIEFKADDEILVNDKSIVGFDFIIETWNEQPILTNLMDEYIGKIDIDSFEVCSEDLKLSKIQKEFRKTEIKNTSYLRQSISSLLEFNELEDKVIFLNIENSITYPKYGNEEQKTKNIVAEPEPHYLQAAKKGKLKYRETLSFEQKHKGISIKIKVIKEGAKYILSVRQPEEVELVDISGTLLKQISQNLYDNLEGGLYFIRIKGIEKDIRIRLK